MEPNDVPEQDPTIDDPRMEPAQTTGPVVEEVEFSEADLATEDQLVHLHPETMQALALAIAAAVPRPEGHEFFLNPAATEPVVNALADSIRDTCRQFISAYPTVDIEIAHVTLKESVAIGPNETEHIDTKTQKFARLNLKMSWRGDHLLVEWFSGTERKSRIIPGGNVRHLTPSMAG